jgi:hypothetical protein
VIQIYRLQRNNSDLPQAREILKMLRENMIHYGSQVTSVKTVSQNTTEIGFQIAHYYHWCSHYKTCPFSCEVESCVLGLFCKMEKGNALYLDMTHLIGA